MTSSIMRLVEDTTSVFSTLVAQLNFIISRSTRPLKKLQKEVKRTDFPSIKAA